LPISLAVALQGWGTRLSGVRLSPGTDRTGLTAGSRTILVVDDDRGVRRLTARMLRGEGYRVLEAGSGTEALQVLDSEPGVHLLLTDIVMPEMHGLELAEQAQARRSMLKVLLMTGHALELTVQLDPQNNRLPVLLKPFSKEQLTSKVRDAIGEQRS
jgi:two-component system, cell cycle sensor histidine kinase and response regulator CckA